MKWAMDNSAAIQALMAMAMVFVTVVLSVITWYYAKVTHQMATIMQQQVEASFQPYVDTAITFKAHGTGWFKVGEKEGSSGFNMLQRDDSVYGGIIVENKSPVPLKLHSIKMDVHFNEAPFNQARFKDAVQECQNIVLYPGRQKEFDLIVHVPPEAINEKAIRKVLLQCTDLTGRSRHTFVISEDSKDTTHYSGFREDIS